MRNMMAIRIRNATIAWLLGAAAAAPHALSGQVGGPWSVGAGLTIADRGGTAPHLAMIWTRPLSAIMDLTGTGAVAVGDLFGLGREVMPSAGVGVQVGWPTGGMHPVVGGEIMYIRTSLSEGRPFAYGLGVGGELGVEWGTDDRVWRIQLGARAFGNVFYRGATTKLVYMFTISRSP